MSGKRRRGKDVSSMVPIVIYYDCRLVADFGGLSGRPIKEGPFVEPDQMVKNGGSESEPLYRSDQNFVSHWREYETLMVPRQLLERLLEN